MKPVPYIPQNEYTLGSSKHLPKMFMIPHKYRQPQNPYVDFIIGIRKDGTD